LIQHETAHSNKHDEGRDKQIPGISSFTLEAEDKGNEVKRERHDPEEGNDCNFL
jgi:hypothetical protein